MPYFKDEPSLCVASLIQKYLHLTENLRQPNCVNLFVTYKKPHGPASRQTLSRWVKDTLRVAGIDANVFKGHSTRHASTSAALRKGISVETIKKCAGWTERSSTFARFYNRPLVQAENFLETVFSLDL